MSVFVNLLFIITSLRSLFILFFSLITPSSHEILIPQIYCIPTYVLYVLLCFTHRKKQSFFCPRPRTIFCLLGGIVTPVRMRDLDNNHRWYDGELYCGEIHWHHLNLLIILKSVEQQTWYKAIGNKQHYQWVRFANKKKRINLILTKPLTLTALEEIQR